MIEFSKEQTYEFKMPERFNSDTPREIVAELQALPHGKYCCVVLDMSETTAMDSSGIGVLVYLYKELTARSKALVLKRPHRNIFNLLIETGIDRLFDVELSSGVKKADAKFDDLDVQLDMADEMAGDICVVKLSGVMSYPAGSMLFKKNMYLYLATSGRILLDMGTLAFFDGLCVGSLLRISRTLLDNGGTMKICGANHIVRNILEGMGIDALVPFYETREAAIEAWGGEDSGQIVDRE